MFDDGGYLFFLRICTFFDQMEEGGLLQIFSLHCSNITHLGGSIFFFAVDNFLQLFNFLVFFQQQRLHFYNFLFQRSLFVAVLITVVYPEQILLRFLNWKVRNNYDLDQPRTFSRRVLTLTRRVLISMMSRLSRLELRASCVGGNLDIGGRLAWVCSDL